MNEDLKFLSENRLMDYSLLLCISRIDEDDD